MRTSLKLTAVLALAVASASAPAAARLVSTSAGPAFSSIGPLAFAPDGTLFAADRQAASIFALDLGSQASSGMTAAWFAIVLLTAYFMFIGGSTTGLLFPHVRLFSVVLVTGVLVGWAVAARSDPTLAPRSAIWPALLVGLVAFATSTLLSANLRVSIEYLAYAVLLVLLYLLLVRIVSKPALRVRIIGLAGGLAVLISVLYIVQVVQHWITWWSGSAWPSDGNFPRRFATASGCTGNFRRRFPLPFAGRGL